MDRNTIIGLVLIMGLLIGTWAINQPTKEELNKQIENQDTASTTPKADSGLTAAAAPQAADSSTQTVAADSLQMGEEQTVTLENEKIKVVLTNKGGRIKSVIVKTGKKEERVQRWDSSDVELFNGSESSLNYTFGTVTGKTIRTADYYFQVNGKDAVLSGDQEASVSMILDLGDNRRFEQIYTLKGNSNLVDYTVKTHQLQDLIAANLDYIAMDWQILQPVQERSAEQERKVSTIFYAFDKEDIENLSETKEEAEEEVKESLKWISFKQQFFNATLIAEKSFEDGADLKLKNASDEAHVKQLKAAISLPYSHNSAEQYKMQFFFGPNHYNTLKTLDIGLENLIPLGFFGFVNRWIVIPVFNFLDGFDLGYGLVIFLLTIFIKLILFPLVYRSYVSGAKMRILKPEMDEIKAKYGDDLAKTQQENMKLFQKAGVSPLGGCIPLLLQIPILFSLFAFFPSSFELRGESFLWARDLSTYDSIFDLKTIGIDNIPFYGSHVSLFTLLMTISTLIYTRMNNQLTGVNEQMKWISYLMPVMFLGIFNSYASGLSYYYFLANMTTFAQQWAIRKFFVDDKKLHAQMQENKKKPVKKNFFQKRMEEMTQRQGVDPKNLNKGRKK